jgi:hypothetical protein
MRKRRLRTLAALALLLLLLAGCWIAGTWDRLCGNQPIRFYGRVVDASGAGMNDVEVTFQIRYSNAPVLPVMYGRAENLRQAKVVSDQSGNFALTSGSGYGISIVEFSRSGTKFNLAGSPPYPYSSFSYDSPQIQREIPDVPTKRITYPLK